MKDQLSDANRPKYTVPTLVSTCCHKEGHVWSSSCFC